MNRLLIYIGLMMFTLTLSCSTEIERPSTDVDGLWTVNVPIRLSVQPMDVCYNQTKSGDAPAAAGEEEYPIEVTEFWFIEFDDSGKLLGVPVYYESSDLIALALPEPGTPAYEGVVIAAVNGIDDTLFNPENCATKETLLTTYYTHTVDDIFRTEDNQDIALYGSVPITPATGTPAAGPLTCTLVRNAVKINFTVTNRCPVPNFRITHVYVGNIPKKFYYYVNNEPVEYVDHYMELETPILVGNSGSFTCYIPQNLKGTLDASLGATDETKNTFAPENATYIEFYGTDDIYWYGFKYYPGSNMQDNFDLKSNFEYNLSVEIISYFSKTDSRIERINVENY